MPSAPPSMPPTPPPMPSVQPPMPPVPRALRGLVPDWTDWTDVDTLLAGLFDGVYADACAISHGNTVGGARIRTGDIRMITAVEVPVSVRPRNHTHGSVIMRDNVYPHLLSAARRMVAEAESSIAPLIEDIWLNAMRSPTVRVVTTKQFGRPQLELRAARDIKGGEKLTDIPFLWLEVLDENHLQLVYDADDKCIGPAPVNADMSFGREVPKTGGGTSAKSWIGCGPARLHNHSCVPNLALSGKVLEIMAAISSGNYAFRRDEDGNCDEGSDEGSAEDAFILSAAPVSLPALTASAAKRTRYEAASSSGSVSVEPNNTIEPASPPVDVVGTADLEPMPQAASSAPTSDTDAP